MIIKILKKPLVMGSNINEQKITFLVVLAMLFISCGGDGPIPSTESSTEQKTPVEGMAVDKVQNVAINGAIIFVDKSASIQKLDPIEISKAGEQIFQKLKTFLGEAGGEVTIYFIHKDLAGASPFYKVNCYMKDTQGLTSLPLATARNKYKRDVDGLLNHIIEAIKTPINQSTSTETDLWITLKKAEDVFVNLPQGGKRLLIYYSDMVEAVSKPKCGKNYERTKFKDVPEAIAMGRKDATPIKQCYNIDTLSGPPEVFLCFPVGALQTSKHPYMFDYWKALFSEFEAKKVSSNL
jgi:hypothetical protein